MRNIVSNEKREQWETPLELPRYSGTKLQASKQTSIEPHRHCNPLKEIPSLYFWGIVHPLFMGKLSSSYECLGDEKH